jgi:hypothetical protein
MRILKSLFWTLVGNTRYIVGCQFISPLQKTGNKTSNIVATLQQNRQHFGPRTRQMAFASVISKDINHI